MALVFWIFITGYFFGCGTLLYVDWLIVRKKKKRHLLGG